MTRDGIELEGDDKHVKGLIEEWNMQECSIVSTPYVKPPAHLLTTEVDFLCPLRMRPCFAGLLPE